MYVFFHDNVQTGHYGPIGRYFILSSPKGDIFSRNYDNVNNNLPTSNFSGPDFTHCRVQQLSWTKIVSYARFVTKLKHIEAVPAKR